MITYYQKSSRAKEVQVLDEYCSGAWVNVEHPTPAEITEIAEKFNLDKGDLKDALDQDEMPRLKREGDVSYIYLRHVHSGGEHEPTTSPLLIVIGPELFMTVAYRKMPQLERFLDGQVEFSTAQHHRLVLVLIGEIIDQYEASINDRSRHIQMIRSQLRSHTIQKEDFVEFVIIEDELNDFLSALQPLSAILRRLSLGNHAEVAKQDKDYIEDLLLNNEQSIGACISNVKTIVNIRGAYSTIASNELNRTMKILTGATVIIALPNVFFGMYGMNVTLPFADLPIAYFIVVGATVIIMIITVWIARTKKII